jgi:hypothetical protein
MADIDGTLPGSEHSIGTRDVPGSLNGLFKEIYNQLKDLVPANTKMADMIPFAPGDKELGAAYNEPVVLGLEGGVTYGGSEGEAFALRTPSSFTLKNARVKSVEMVLRSAISTAVASRSQNSSGAFERGIKLLTGNMMKSMYHRLEVSLLYGQKGIAAVESVSGTGPSVIKVLDQEWAAGIWVGTTKHKIEVFSSDLSTKRAELTISGYDISAKTVTVVEDASAVQANDVIFFSGACEAGAVHKDMLGLHKIAEERVSLFEISNANEPLFQGNLVDVGTNSAAAVLSFAKVEEAVAKAVEKGLGEEQMTVMVNVNSWNDLLTEQTAKRRYTSDYSSKIKEGSRAIEFEGQAGSIKIIPSTYVKEGYAYAFCEKDLIRIGSSDITFDPKGYEGEFFRLLDNHSGYEIRAYSDQALFSSRPSCITVLRYIKNATHS